MLPLSKRSSASSVLKDLSVRASATDDTPNLAYLDGQSEDQCDHLLNGGENLKCHLSFSSPPQSSQSSPVKQTPPAVSKKPQILFVLPFPAQPLNGHLHTSSLSQTEDGTEATPRQRAEEEEDDTIELEESLGSCSPSEASPFEPPPASQGAHLGNGPCVNGESLEEEAEEDGNSSIAGSLSSKEDDNGKSHGI